MSDVIDLGKEKKFPVNGELVGEINKVIDRFAGRVSLVEAVGALELVKIGVLDRAEVDDA